LEPEQVAVIPAAPEEHEGNAKNADTGFILMGVPVREDMAQWFEKMRQGELPDVEYLGEVVVDGRTVHVLRAASDFRSDEYTIVEKFDTDTYTLVEMESKVTRDGEVVNSSTYRLLVQEQLPADLELSEGFCGVTFVYDEKLVRVYGSLDEEELVNYYRLKPVA
jgi:hypothetical protein